MVILVTSALPYVNNVPHLGNIIGAVLSGDVMSRYIKRNGEDVIYLCGTDEYGTATEMKARQEKLTCQEICDKYHKIHKEVYDWLNIDFDVWGRTSTETQTELAQDIYNDIKKNKHLEDKKHLQIWCDKCKIFLADRYLQGTCYYCKSISNGDQCDSCGKLVEANKLIDPFCKTCGNDVNDSKIESIHKHLKLNNFQKQLIEFNDKITMTNTAKSITKHWLKSDLYSRCITRDLKWGTPVPDMEDKVFYVWFDAPIGYLSILKHKKGDVKIDKWYQFMAKDNVPFHTVLFPATLMATGKEYPMVTHLSAIEYLQLENGEKFSKSNNIGVFCDELIKLDDMFGLHEDYWRFYLIHIRPENNDTCFSWRSFINYCNGILVNNIGNYFNRCIRLVQVYLGERKLTYNNDYPERDEFITDIIKQYDNCFSELSLRSALDVVLKFGKYLNKTIHDDKPWVSWKLWEKEYDSEMKKETIKILTFNVHAMIILLDLLKPFIPRTVDNVLKIVLKVKTKEEEYLQISPSKFKLPFKRLDEKKLMDCWTKIKGAKS